MEKSQRGVYVSLGGFESPDRSGQPFQGPWGEHPMAKGWLMEICFWQMEIKPGAGLLSGEPEDQRLSRSEPT